MPDTILGALNSVLTKDKRKNACPCGVYIQMAGNRQLKINTILLILEC